MTHAEFLDLLTSFVKRTLEDKEATEAQLDAATSIASTLIRSDVL